MPDGLIPCARCDYRSTAPGLFLSAQGERICRSCWDYETIRQCHNCGVNGLADIMPLYEQASYCETCHNQLFYECHCCGENFPRDDCLAGPNNEPVCTPCWETNYFICGECERVCSIENNPPVGEGPGGAICQNCESQQTLPPEMRESGNTLGDSTALEEEFFNSCAANDDLTIG